MGRYLSRWTRVEGAYFTDMDFYEIDLLTPIAWCLFLWLLPTEGAPWFMSMSWHSTSPIVGIQLITMFK